QGYFRAGPLSAQQLSKTPPPLANNWQQYNNLLGSGVNFWAINPHALDNPEAYWQSLYPDTTRQEGPGFTWAVRQRETASYLQAALAGSLGGLPSGGTAGVPSTPPKLDFPHLLPGSPAQSGTSPADAGTHVTERSYTDVLPALNFSLNM